jgi:hypothetical protein
MADCLDESMGDDRVGEGLIVPSASTVPREDRVLIEVSSVNH